jgi:hypothetical protein
MLLMSLNCSDIPIKLLLIRVHSCIRGNEK